MENQPSSSYDIRWPPVVGAEPIGLRVERVVGMWAIRLGPYGCRDEETEGGVIILTPDSNAMGGGSRYSFTGDWEISDTGLRSRLTVCRHWSYGGEEYGKGRVFAAWFTAEAIGPDRFEGLLHREGFPESRLVMKRISMGIDSYSTTSR